METTPNAPQEKPNDFQDFNTFKQLDSLAQLYFYCVLDLLVDLAYKVSSTFTQHPQLYRSLAPSDTDILGKFYTRYGTEPEFLEQKQRIQIYSAIFWTHDNFPQLSDSLLAACARYTANVRPDNRDLLAAEVETVLTPFRQYLLDLQGGSVQWSVDRLTEVTQAAYAILRNDTVARVFGVPNPPSVNWPFVPDSNGDILVEEISEKRMTRGGFSLAQQVALRGATTIDDVIKCTGRVSIELIRRSNSWNAASSAIARRSLPAHVATCG